MKEFFDAVRDSLFGGSLRQSEVENLSRILLATAGLPTPHRAYILATVYHETGPAGHVLHMTPRRELWGPTLAQIKYEGRTDLGNTIPGDGKRFMGRGYVQITGRANYAKASSLIGVDLVGQPDLALVGEHAVKILVRGMTEGWFTGKKLSDYTSYVDMRRIVNGTDKAELIAGYADKFETGLKTIPIGNEADADIDGPTDSRGPDSEPKNLRALVRKIINLILRFFQRKLP